MCKIQQSEADDSEVHAEAYFWCVTKPYTSKPYNGKQRFLFVTDKHHATLEIMTAHPTESKTTNLHLPCLHNLKCNEAKVFIIVFIQDVCLQSLSSFVFLIANRL